MNVGEDDFKKNIDLVLFDFGGVIAEEGFKQGLAVIAQANGIDKDEFIKTAFETTYSSGYVLGKVPESAFWDAMRQKTGIKGDNLSLRHEIVSRFILRDWMMDLVKKLKAKNFTVGILSDQTDILDKLNEKYDFFKFFDYVFNSYHLGKGKRDPSLFDDISRMVKKEPGQILFIDDDPQNVDRARQEGWKTILYIDRESFESSLRAVLKLT